MMKPSIYIPFNIVFWVSSVEGQPMCLPFCFRHWEDINGSYLKIKGWLYEWYYRQLMTKCYWWYGYIHICISLTFQPKLWLFLTRSILSHVTCWFVYAGVCVKYRDIPRKTYKKRKKIQKLWRKRNICS
jgi:hypothetical protein